MSGQPRQTRQRTAVRDALESLTEFKSAQQLHELLRLRGDAVGLATVYRCLQSLAEAGEVDAITGADGETRYRRCSAEHHHHLVCRSCGRTVEVQTEALEAWTVRVAGEHGFRDARHSLEIFGLCADC